MPMVSWLSNDVYICFLIISRGTRITIVYAVRMCIEHNVYPLRVCVCTRADFLLLLIHSDVVHFEAHILRQLPSLNHLPCRHFDYRGLHAERYSYAHIMLCMCMLYVLKACVACVRFCDESHERRAQTHTRSAVVIWFRALAECVCVCISICYGCHDFIIES